MGDSQAQINIAIYRTGGIGDVILSTVSLDYIQGLGRSSRVYWISFNPLLSFIKACHPSIVPVEISSSHTYAENARSINRIIRRVDVVIDLQRSPRSIILCKQLARRHGAAYHTWNKGSIRRTRMVMRSRMNLGNRIKHDFLRNTHPRCHLMLACARRALLPFGMGAEQAYPSLGVPDLSGNQFDELEENTLVLGVCAGGLHSIKWAPTALFANLLNDVLRRSSEPIQLVFLGDQYDREPSLQIIAELEGKQPVVNYCGQLNLTETAFVLDQCALFLSNDTALAHMAEALGKDVAMLFGPTVEAFGYAPFRRGSMAFSSDMKCRPCTKSGNTSCRYGDKRCFDGIDPGAVSSFLIDRVEKLVAR